MSQAYLRHLANFVEIIRSGSMAAAAERTGAVVSAMSRSLAILENYYGFTLAQRTPRGLVLTEGGRRVFEEAEKIVSAASTALQIKSGDQPLRGQVVLSAPREICNLWISDVLGAIVTSAPDINLRIIASDEILDPRRQRIDIILRVGRGDVSPSFNVFHEMDIEPVLVAAPSCAEASQGAKGGTPLPIPLIRFSTGAGAGPLVMRHRKSKAERAFAFASECVVSDPNLAITLCRAGYGATACLAPSVTRELAAGRLVRLLPSYGFHMARLRLGIPKGDASAATQFVLSRLQEGLTKL